MSAHKKLMQARIKLQNSQLKKTGLNPFAKYEYFELSDFLPKIQEIFSEVGLCGIISYGTDLATLTITDFDGGEPILITSPMAEANLKGCTPIQNLGAAETYTRRYLWVTALEIVENDVLDATTGKEVARGKPTSNPVFQPDEDEVKFLTEILDMVLSLDTDYASAAEYLHKKELDADEKTWIWDKLDSKTRAGIKKVSAK